MSRKITALLLVLCLAISLAACSSGGSKEQSSQSQESSQTQEPSQSAESSTAEESSEPTEEPDESSADNAETEEADDSESQYAKRVEASYSDEEKQELLTCIAEAISEDYLIPNDINAEDFAWPTDQAAWDYYNGVIANGERQNGLLDQLYFEIAIGSDQPVSEALVPASPDKEIMDAAAKGISNWLHAHEEQFQSGEHDINEMMYLLKNRQYILDKVTFE